MSDAQASGQAAAQTALLRIPADLIRAIADQAQAEAPNEACGYLVGAQAGLIRSARRRIRMTNADASPEHFSFLPKEQFAALKDARETGEELVAVYHSHPETPARMSEEDIRLANDPNTIYVIHSLATGDTRGFIVSKGDDGEKLVTDAALEIVREGTLVTEDKES